MGVLVGSSVGPVAWKSTPKPVCTHCGKNHRGKCRLLMSGCFRCESIEHFLKDCPWRSAPTAPTQTQRSALTVQRSSRPMRLEIAGTSGRASETIKQLEVEVAPHVYAMARKELDLVDIVRGTFSNYNTFKYVLIDPNYIHPYICIVLSIDRGYR